MLGALQGRVDEARAEAEQEKAEMMTDSRFHKKAFRKKWPTGLVFAVGDRVLDVDHPTWGAGVVIRVCNHHRSPQQQTVQFAGRRRAYEYLSGFGKLKPLPQPATQGR